MGSRLSYKFGIRQVVLRPSQKRYSNLGLISYKEIRSYTEINHFSHSPKAIGVERGGLALQTDLKIEIL